MTADAVGGVWDYALRLTDGLLAAGHQVHLAVLGEDPPQVPRRSGLEVSAAAFPLEWLPSGPAAVPDAGRWISQVAEGWKADVVHLNQLTYAPWIGRPTLVVAHSDVLSWFGEVRGEPAPPAWDPYRRVVADGLAVAGVVVAPTAYQSELLARHHGRAADRVIWNAAPAPEDGLDGVPEDSAATDGQHGRGCGPSGHGEPLLLSMGRAWDPAKGVRVLDRALEHLGRLAPEAHFLGATTGPDGSHYVPRAFTCHGHVSREEADAWLVRADLYVAGSLYEPFGLAPLEAALRGCTLVLPSIGSFRELWDGCAAFYPAGDAAMLAATLNHLLAHNETCRALGARARRRALERFGPARMVVDYVQAYQTLARPRRHAAPAPVNPPAVEGAA